MTWILISILVCNEIHLFNTYHFTSKLVHVWSIWVHAGPSWPMQNWAERWGMRFNPKKCYIMHIHRSQIRSRIYQLCGEVLYSVSKAKYLGVLISNDLSWHEQVYIKWQQKRIPHSISYLETWSIAPDLWDRLPTAPLHFQAWSIAPVSGILICRRMKSDWRFLINKLFSCWFEIMITPWRCLGACGQPAPSGWPRLFHGPYCATYQWA